MTDEHYQEFIEEAFIEPIRSVLIVDDDYPTFAEILEPGAESGSRATTHGRKAWRDDPERIERVIRRFRERSRPLLVDIHDGTNVTVGGDVVVAKHLHQSDLLVLDYQLEREKSGDGNLAIEILRSLMSNAHFNLVVVYTNENLDTVFDEVRWGMIPPSSDSLSEDETNDAKELIETTEQGIEGFWQRVSGSVASAQYFHSRQHPKSCLRTMAKGQQPYSAFKDLSDEAEWTPNQRKLVLRHLLKKMERDREIHGIEPSGAENLSWSSGSTKWLKSDSVFVAFSEKTDDDDLLSELQTALHDWSPRPSRLLLTKLRAEMDEHGIAAQGRVLRNHHALAYWYDRLLRTDDERERRWLVAESVSRHSGRLMSDIVPRVEGFVSRLIAAETKAAGGDVDRICKNHFNLDLTDDEARIRAALEHNAFVCGMEPEGWHLTTGHVFSMGDGHWLCVSPACDMVPAQVSKWRRDAFGEERLPFVAVELRPVSHKKLLEDIQSNRYVVLQLNDELKSFCFNDPSRSNSAPRWDVFHAEKRGEFAGSGLLFSMSRAERGKTRLTFKRHEATVVAQLRYEYALNLVQKLGVSLTRIGLDFSGGRG